MTTTRIVPYPSDRMVSAAGGSRFWTAVQVTLLVLAILPLAGRAQVSTESRSLYARGHEALGRGELGNAIELLEQAARQSPEDTTILFDLGVAYERSGSEENAMATYRRVLSASPSHEASRKALERLGAIGWSSDKVLDRADSLIDQDRITEASYLYKRYLADHPDSERAQVGLERCTAALAKQQPASAPSSLPEPAAEIEASTPLRAAADKATDDQQIEVTPAAATEIEEVPEADSAPPELLAEEAPAADSEVSETREVDAQAVAVDRETSDLSQSETPPAEAVESPIQSESDAHAAASPLTPTTASAAPEEESRVGRNMAPFVLVLFVLAITAGILVWRYRRNCTVRGIVEQFPLPDLLQWLGLSKKVGVLKITTATALGRIHLESGRMIRAEWSGEEGEEALNSILALPKGSFVFRERAIPKNLERNLDLSVQQALMNWAYETDEAGREESSDELSDFLDSVDDNSLNIDLPF